MSLINDALKRAKDAQQTNPPPGGSDLQFRPAESAAQPGLRFRGTLPGLVYVFVVFTFLVLGMVFLREISDKARITAAARSPTTPALVANTSPTDSASAQTRQSTPANVTAGSAARGKESGSTNSLATIASSGMAQPAPLKLQAVFFDPNRPSAIISGKSVCVGDKVAAFRVTKISADSVTLIGGDQTTVLKLK